MHRCFTGEHLVEKFERHPAHLPGAFSGTGQRLYRAETFDPDRYRINIFRHAYFGTDATDDFTLGFDRRRHQSQCHCGVATLHLDYDRPAGTAPDDVDPFGPTGDGVAISGGHQVASRHARGRGGLTRNDALNAGRHEWTQPTDTYLVEEITLTHVVDRKAGEIDRRVPLETARSAHDNAHRAAVEDGFERFPEHPVPRRRWDAFDLDDLHTGFQAGPGRNGIGRHIADDRLGPGYPNQEHNPAGDESQREIGRRSGDDDRHAGSPGFVD